MYFHGWFEGKVCTERKPKVLEGRKKERRVELEEVIKFAECGVHEPCRGGGMNNTLVKDSLRGRCNRGAGICELSTNLFQRLTNAFGSGMGELV